MVESDASPGNFSRMQKVKPHPKSEPESSLEHSVPTVYMRVDAHLVPKVSFVTWTHFRIRPGELSKHSDAWARLEAVKSESVRVEPGSSLLRKLPGASMLS